MLVKSYTIVRQGVEVEVSVGVRVMRSVVQYEQKAPPCLLHPSCVFQKITSSL